MGNVHMEAKDINYRSGQKKMSVEEALKNTSGEAAAIAQLQQDVSDLNDVKANKITIAPAFSAEASYDPGDLVYYNGLTYRCVNAHSGEWDADDFAATTIDNELAELRSGLTSVETSLTSMDRVISFPFTMPSDVSSTVIGENISIGLGSIVPENAYIIGVSLDVFTQKRTILGEYFGQVGCINNYLFLINLLKSIPTGYNGISGYLIVGIPHS